MQTAKITYPTQNNCKSYFVVCEIQINTTTAIITIPQLLTLLLLPLLYYPYFYGYFYYYADSVTCKTVILTIPIILKISYFLFEEMGVISFLLRVRWCWAHVCPLNMKLQPAASLAGATLYATLQYFFGHRQVSCFPLFPVFMLS